MTATPLMPSTDTPLPYASTARSYRDAGWLPLPLPFGAKFPPPAGFTGAKGADPSDADVDGWVTRAGGGNVALRLPDGVLGVDVDAYEAKPGAETLAGREAQWGALPPTVRSTARGAGVSGIRLFRVPPNLQWPGEVGPGIETVHRGHRYMVAPPSVQAAGTYEWLDADGVTCPAPRPEDLPELPTAWVAGLTRGQTARDRSDVTDSDVDAFLAGLASGRPAADIAETLRGLDVALTGSPAGRHPAMLSAVEALVGAGAGGAHGVRAALDAARATFLAAKESGAREFDRALRGSVVRVLDGTVEVVAHADRLAFGEAMSASSPGTPAGARKSKDDDKRGEARLTADDVLEFILGRYRIGRSTDGLLFAVPTAPGSAQIAREVRSIRSDVARRFRDERKASTGRGVVIGRETLSSALETAAAYAEVADDYAVPVALRAAQVGDDRVVLDLGDNTGRLVEVTARGWEIVEASADTPLFRRSEATQALPVPARGGELDELRRLLDLQPDDPRWLLVQGWLVASLFSETPRPILWATGPQGSGKSTRARMILSLIEPADSLGREPGRNERDDTTSARGRYMVSFDNVGQVSAHTSDWLCRLVTGVTDDRRALYTDDGLRPVSYRRSGVATSLTLPPGLGSDALERLVLVDFTRLPADSRRSESALWTGYDAARPAMLGALLDLVALTLRHLPAASREHRARPYRMVDFGDILAALDRGLGLPADLGHLAAYVASVNAAQTERALDDPFTGAVLRVVAAAGGTWSGTYEAALRALDRYAGDANAKWWPTNPRALRSQITKAEVPLSSAGVTCTVGMVRGSRRLRLTGPATPPDGAAPREPAEDSAQPF